MIVMVKILIDESCLQIACEELKKMNTLEKTEICLYAHSSVRETIFSSICYTALHFLKLAGGMECFPTPCGASCSAERACSFGKV